MYDGQNKVYKASERDGANSEDHGGTSWSELSEKAWTLLQCSGSTKTMSDDKEAYKDSFRKPSVLLKFAGLSSSDTVLEISAGFGYLAKRMSKTAAQVHAQNGAEYRELFESFGIQKEIEKMEKDYKIQHFWASFEDPGQSKTAVYDLVTLQNSFHDLYDLPVDRNKFFSSIKKAMRPKGRFLLVDHQAGPGRGSKDAKELHRVEESVVREELKANGFKVTDTSDMFKYPEDDYTKSAWKEPNIETDRFVLLCEKDEGGAAAKPEIKTDEPPAKKQKET